MAGGYPDPVGHIYPFDLDDTIVQVVGMTGTIISTFDATKKRNLTQFSGRGTDLPWLHTNYYLTFIFPRPVDLKYIHCFHETGFVTYYDYSTSTDTTNGFDGNWTTNAIWSPASMPGDAGPSIRNDPVAIVGDGVKAFRIRYQCGSSSYSRDWQKIILWAEASGASYDGLEFWHPTLDQRLDPVEYGDVPRNNQSDLTFRVKNQSSTLAANGIVLSSEAITDSTPSVADDFTFAPDGSTFTSTLDIGNLASGGISSVVTVRKQTPVDAAMGLWFPRWVATPTSWEVE